MEKTWKNQSKTKIIDPQKLKNKVEQLKKEHKSLISLNGSFDVLHAGHLQILYEASLLGDILIVALNSDQSIKRYKGENRPFISLEYRLQMIAAIGFVDYVTYFEEDNPIKILDVIKPDIHVNGSEYGENCIEADIVKKNGGKIHIVKLVDGLSTTQIVKKIKTCV